MERTIGGEARFEGNGLFGGKPVDMRVAPAGPGSGITFVREDLDGAPEIPARWSSVVETRNRTVLGDGNGTSVGTVEHLMAAFAGLGIDNARVALSGDEVPVMDGSSADFVDGLESAGLAPQDSPRPGIRVRRRVEVSEGDAGIRVEPGEGFTVDGTIDYPGTAIGRQRLVFVLGDTPFRDVAEARTFCTLDDMTRLRGQNRGLGGTSTNTLVVNGKELLSGGPLRHEDEFVRHKVLDCVGDLYLAGAQLQGRVTFVRGGHRMNRRLLEGIFSDRGNWERTDEAERLSEAA